MGRRAQSLPEPLESVTRESCTFVQLLAHQRTLLERRCYVVLAKLLVEA
jgi:hypothetical protein